MARLCLFVQAYVILLLFSSNSLTTIGLENIQFTAAYQ